ncbi:thermonuclease family protein [Verrucomicrobia bacterium]|jgi:micrococcal nuclease|nr:thermonuclease family protein [Verrucomicrobiota bacterium]
MYEYRAELVRVIDGDTVDLIIDCGFSIFTHQRVRLYGINTPETRTRDKEEKVKGLAAKARLEELLQSTDNILITTKLDKKGKYGRLLGTLWDENKENNFNQMLLSEGHAVEYGKS